MTKTFRVAGGNASYALDEVSTSEAFNVGCPMATHKLAGRYETTYGNVREHSGRWTRQGVLATFTPAWSAEQGTGEPLRGYVK